MSSDQHVITAFSLGSKSAMKYIVKASESDNDILEKPYSNIEEHVNGEDVGEPVEKDVIEPKRAAKIHDFCFGIPYGKFHLVLIFIESFYTLLFLQSSKFDVVMNPICGSKRNQVEYLVVDIVYEHDINFPFKRVINVDMLIIKFVLYDRAIVDETQ